MRSPSPPSSAAHFTSRPLAVPSGVRGQPPVIVRPVPRRQRRGYPRRTGTACPTPSAKTTHPNRHSAECRQPPHPVLSQRHIAICRRSSSGSTTHSPPMRSPSPPPPATHFTCRPLAIQSGVRGHPPVVVRSAPRQQRRGCPRRTGTACPTPSANPFPADAATIPAPPATHFTCRPRRTREHQRRLLRQPQQVLERDYGVEIAIGPGDRRGER